MGKDNQHFIPRGYLRGFTIAGEKSLIWEYDKTDGTISRNPKSISQICSNYQYYAQKNEDGSTDKESIENSFHQIEDKAPRVIEKIHPRITAEKVHLTEDDRVVLSFFAAIQLTRVPNFRDGIEEMHRRVVEIGLSHQIEKAREDGTLPERVEELYKEGKIKIDIEPFVSLKSMVNVAEEGTIRLLDKVWHFAIPEKGMSLVTSDNPVYFQAPEKFRDLNAQIGPFHPASEVTLPLRNNLMLICTPSIGYSKSEYQLINMTAMRLDEQDTINLNKRAILAAKQYIYSGINSEKLAALVSEFKGSSQRVIV